MVDNSSLYDCTFALLGFTFYVVFRTVLQICPTLQQVQNCFNDSGDFANHPPFTGNHSFG